VTNLLHRLCVVAVVVDLFTVDLCGAHCPADSAAFSSDEDDGAEGVDVVWDDEVAGT
jgi:hypothetical protein